jgi:cholesterol oxidase
MRRNFWDHQASLYGLYEPWHFSRSTVLVSSGLGGGSLIYANVLLRKPADSFLRRDDSGESKAWPVTYRDIEQSYIDIETELGANPLPERYWRQHDGPPAVPKTSEFLDAAEDAGMSAEPAPIAVSFGSDQASPGSSNGRSRLHGRERRTCTLVGECDMGCNEGAKNTLDFNYLDRYQQLGGEIRTCCEAVAIGGSEGRYEVRYVQHLAARERACAEYGPDRATAAALLDPDVARAAAIVHAPVVVCAAGALGSTRLLLSSRAELPALSPRLGRGFSSNGDLLTFARGCRVDSGSAPRDLAPSRGPVITAYAQDRAGGERVWLEDAGGPGLSEWGWQLPELPGDAVRTLIAQRRALIGLMRGHGRSRVSLLASSLLGDARSSAGMLPMLSMGLDGAGGRMLLDRDALTLDWNPAASESYFDRAEQAAAKVARRLGGELWPKTNRLRRSMRGVTVHPLGGCAMGEDPSEGVVAGTGQVFGCPGLYVADGSVMPAPVGPNPSLTIAAIADRIASGIVDDHFGGP